MQNTPWSSGQIAVTNTAANLVNPPTLTGGVNPKFTKTYLVLKKITITNKTGSSHTISLYIGATGGSAAGTEFACVAKTVPANDRIEIVCNKRLDTTDFLTGLADANTSIVIDFDGEMGLTP
jgi:hypothetical protein